MVYYLLKRCERFEKVFYDSGPWWSKENEEFFKVLVVYGQWHPLEAKIIGRKTIRGKELDVVELLDLNDSKKVKPTSEEMKLSRNYCYY